MSINEYGIRDLIAQIDAGDISPVDVANAVATAVEKRNDDLNAYLAFDADDVIAQAKRVTESGEYKNKPLRGLPIAIKDNICVQGRTTTAGSRILERFHSPYNATVVERLVAAGAVIAGKTNLDEFAMGSSTENSAFGPSRNPWHNEYAAGGSSGGSACCVASDLAIAALGSDTGGSIRQPASFCGVVGMKPTYGRVSRYGLIAFASSLDQIGPLTKSVADCATLLAVISGKDANDSTSLAAPVPDFSEDLEAGANGLTVGVPRDFLEEGMDEDVAANMDAVLEKLKTAGAKIVDVSLATARAAGACYYIIANAEASSNLARYDGVKYGHRSSAGSDLYTMYTRTREEGFGEEVKRRILLGTYVLSAGYYDAYYLKAQRVRSLIVRDFESAHAQCDLVATPTAPTAAFRLGEKIDDPLRMYLSDVFTIPVNLAGLPAISVPTGMSKDGLPLSVQLIGRPLEEATVLRGAAGIEAAVDFKRSAGA